jgi:hypothetical protein
MFGKTPRLNPLELRKKLLIAESELNRVQLVQEMQSMGDGLVAVTDRARSFGSIASSVAMLVSGLAALRNGKSAQPGAKRTWFQSVLKGAGMISNLWLALKSQSRGRSGS